MTPAEARERFAAARVARLATADAGGRPHLVPVVFAVEGDRVYTVVDAKPKRTTALRRLRNVAENPWVALLADHYEEDWAALWWVRAEGRGRVVEADAPEARRAVELLRARYPQQRAVGAVLAVDVERWSGWAARARAADQSPRLLICARIVVRLPWTVWVMTARSRALSVRFLALASRERLSVNAALLTVTARLDTAPLKMIVR